jgi:hypothetical protein
MRERMRAFTTIKRKKGTREDPYRVTPIRPRSVVRLSSAARNTPSWKKEIGRVSRIGYYSKKDGLDCIWLVNDLGEYEETLDHDFLFKYFDIIMLSDEDDLYGINRAKIPPIRKAQKRK